MATYTLTTGPDTVTGTVDNDTVNGTAATLDAGDRLTGGAGTDVLALYGSGTFRVDQLATFTGFESITLNNFTSGSATLYLGSQPIAVTGYGSGSDQLYLGSGAVTLLGGGGYNYVYSTSASSWNAANSIDGGYYATVYLNWNSSDNASTYDLTTNTLTHINYLYGYGTNLTLKVNSAVAAGVVNFYGAGPNAKLLTSDAALDLSHSAVSGFTIASSNTTGTNFTVHDVGTAFQIAGGSGTDTITAQGFSFSTDQRNAIFATASVERIVDASGAYTAPPQSQSVFTLTTGPDTVTGTVDNDTVNGTAATLDAGDRLTGGAGTDVLALYGSGTFRVDQLATFTGFESITLNNFTSGSATLYLGSQPIAVTGYGSGSDQLYLGSGAVTLLGGGGYNYVYSTSASSWNAANSIDGGYYATVYLNWNSSDNASTYDLTTNTLTHINYLYGYGTNLTLKVNSAVAAGVVNFYGAGPNAKLLTSDAALDLSHSAVSGFTIASSNTTGTNFTVHDVGTAFQIAGGSGTDTITAQGFSFSTDQRNAIFATASVERIVDASGAYTAPNGGQPNPPDLPQNPNIFTLTAGPDTVTGTANSDTVNGTAATLNAGDSLTGGAGTDVLALYGSGTFRVDQLATFTGFEGITLNNFTSGYATLYLGSQSIAVTGYGSGSEQLYLGSGAVTLQGGSGYNSIYSSSASNWNAANSVDGGYYGSVYLNSNGTDGATYDLTTNTLTHINYLSGYGSNLTVKIDSAVAGGVATFNAYGTNTKLVTSDAALDLSHSAVSGFTVASSNATGTNFTVHDLGTAFQISGGSGTDTITAQGFAFSTDQRNAIFATASVERIVDASGTYTASGSHAPTVTGSGGATSAIEQVAATIDAGLTVTDPDNATLASATVSITGGFHAGQDVLAFTNNGSTMGNIVGSYAAGNGVLSLTSSGATATLAQWQAALRAATYTDTSDAPDTANRTLSFTVNDGTDASAASTKTVSVTAVNDAPAVTAPDFLASKEQVVTASSLFSASDADGNSLVYFFYDNTAGATSGHFTVNGVVQAAGTTFAVTAAQLAQTTFTAGTTSDDLFVNVYDGSVFSGPKEFHVNVPVNHAPAVTAPDFSASKGQVIGASSLFLANDADGDNLLYFFYDNSPAPTSGHFTVNGVVQAAGTTFAVTAAQLAQTTFTAGTGSSDDLFVNVYDGSTFSGPQEFQVNLPVNQAPTVTAPDFSASKGQVINASSLFSANDANGDSLLYFFYDNTAGAGSGHFTVNGVDQTAGTTFAVTAAQLAQTTFTAGTGSSDDLFVNVYDGTTFSGPKEFHVNVPANQAPTVTAPDFSASKGQVVNASQLFLANDANGDSLLYFFYDNSADPASGHFTVNGVVQAAGTTFAVTAEQLAQTTFTAGLSASDDLFVNVYDGSAFSGPKEFHVNIPANQAPTVTASNQMATSGQVLGASSLFSANDADGDSLLYFFYDNSAAASSDHFEVNGVVQTAGTTFAVTAAQLGQTHFVAGTTGDDLFVNAWDGSAYSGPKEFDLSV